MKLLMAFALSILSTTGISVKTAEATDKITDRQNDRVVEVRSASSTKDGSQKEQREAAVEAARVSTLKQNFKFGQRGPKVKKLQKALGKGVVVDGVYGWQTRAAHRAALKTRGLSTRYVPMISAPKKSYNISSNPEHRCPKFEDAFKAHGLVPVEVFSYVAWRESRCQPKAIGWNYHKGMSYLDCKREPADKYKRCKAVKSYDSGLLQINSSWMTVTARVCKAERGDLTVLLNVECNLKVAKYLYEDGGGLQNWSIYQR
jgi:hypothetical protein